MATTRRTDPSTTETCASCGAETTSQHPWVAVMHKKDVAPDREPISAQGDWAAVPICDHCHKNPDTRPMPIKGHFFSRQIAGFAVSVAGSTDIRG